MKIAPCLPFSATSTVVCMLSGSLYFIVTIHFNFLCLSSITPLLKFPIHIQKDKPEKHT